MALANIAYLMSDCGLNVLVLDWDLEAPGLERFLFNKPREIENALMHKGLVDMLLDYKNALLNFRPEEEKPFFPPYQISDYIIPIVTPRRSLGSLSLLPAGERAHKKFAEYSNKVKLFDWQDFYQNWEGEIYFEWLREELENQSDVVLIDSRTGVTEMGGVCTYQMADVIVMFSIASDQSIDGTLRMLKSFSDPELPDLRNGRKLKTIVIPSRIEQISQIEILNAFREKFSQLFGEYLSDELSTESNFFLNHEIPYVPRYAFEELVAVKQTNTALRAKQLEDAYKQLLITLSNTTSQDSILRRKIYQEYKATEVSELESQILTSQTIVKRKSLTVDESGILENHYESLIKAITKGRIVPFLGSDINLCDRSNQGNGALESWQPGCPFPPSGKELAAYLAETFVAPISKHRLDVGCESLPYLSQYAYLTQEGELYDKLHLLALGCQPNRLHKFFATLPAIMRDKGYYPPYPLIVTTNYDCALEQAFEDENEPFDLVFYSNALDAQEQDKFIHRRPNGDLQEIRDPNQYEGFSFEQRPVILKLYGTADQIPEGESLVITEEHYLEYLVSRDLSNLLPAKLLKKFRAQRPTMLFLGYPLGDWNERIILHRIWQNLTSRKRYRWWAIQSNPEPFAQKLWQSYSVVLHDIPLADYITELNKRLRDIADKGNEGYE